tara:strand:+ start:2301 stop:2690 length:390 start_codon:yes stop_codon:yes gene_type:complete
MIGCESNPFVAEPCTSDCYLEIGASSLEMDSNGYYHMTMLGNYSQTFTTLDAYTGIPYHKIGWMADTEIYLHGEWINLVNPQSYTDDEGIGHTVLSVWEENVGDTIKVYVGYNDECGTHYVDSLEVVVD